MSCHLSLYNFVVIKNLSKSLAGKRLLYKKAKSPSTTSQFGNFNLPGAYTQLCNISKMERNIVPSRFSCLKIEDDDFQPVVNKQTKKKADNKQLVKKAIGNAGNRKPVERQELSSNGASKKSKSKAKHDSKQWEEWQKKDDEYINENFEQDLQSAIMQSRLDYENHKKNYAPDITSKGQEKPSKKKKTKTMSLDQFLEKDKSPTSKTEEKNKTPENDEKFFESVLNSAKEELRREKVEQNRKERSNNIEEVISLAQAQDKLQKEKEKNEQLQKELEESKKEITSVKKRNKTLCSMLSQGEMKDKATLLLDLEKMTTVKEELTEELARLHKLLEQERSKSSAASSNSLPESDIKQKSKR
ncbi:G kinase-anchoring protein 1 isoform X2 [Diabrotica virgifera virgifera]|uniref:G kinase-anchoring protein 1-like isoform X2 n=1 Tax=Diabrotica virgifera virgifera TaxID=50390 RepID=A0A6P7F940_DIAVI|nr:G kinase-anchoring protein 1 isoform X2 [Diabrotica virgifera virgifera]